MAFGKEIKRLRENSGLTSIKLANLLDVDHDKYRKWEQRDANPKAEDQKKIEEFFGANLEEISKLEKIPPYSLVRYNRLQKNKQLESYLLSMSESEKRRFVDFFTDFPLDDVNKNNLLEFYFSKLNEEEQRLFLEYVVLPPENSAKEQLMTFYISQLDEIKKNEFLKFYPEYSPEQKKQNVDRQKKLQDWFLYIDNEERREFIEPYLKNLDEDERMSISVLFSTGETEDLKKAFDIWFLKLDKNEKRKVLLPFKAAFLEEDPSHKIPFYDNIRLESKPTPMIDPGDWFRNATGAMRVHGHGMDPKYPNGSIVLFKEVIDKELIVFGQDYVVETSDYILLKRLQKRDDDAESFIAENYNEETTKSGSPIYQSTRIPKEKVVKLYLVLGKIEKNE